MDPPQVLALVDRLTVRLASADEAKLEGVLATLLPQLLQLLGFPDEAVRRKVMGLVTHVHTRLKALPAVRLPVGRILSLWSTSLLNGASPYIVNFSNMFLRLGYDRATATDKSALLPTLVQSISQHTRDHQMTLLGMFLQGVLSRTAQYSKTFEVPSHLRGEGATGRPTEDLLYQFYQPTAPTAASLDRDAAVVVDFLCHAMMYPAGTTLASKTPPGLSPVDVRVVLNGREALSSAEALPIKLSIIQFFKAHLQRQLEAKQQSADQHRWLASKALLLAIAAQCDAHHEVAAAGDTLLKQYVEPAVDLEDRATLQPLYECLLGNGPLPTAQLRGAAGAAEAGAAVSIELQRSPGPLAVQLKALALLSRSTAAIAEGWPANFFVIQRTLTDADPKRRLLPGGLHFLRWALSAAQGAALRPYAADLAPLLTDVLARLRDGGPAAGPEVQMARGSLYVSLGALCKQCRDVVGPSTAMMEFFFDALEHDAPALRGSVQEGLVEVCAAMWPLGGEARDRCTALLLANAAKDAQPACQLAAVQCANRLFEFAHTPARLICLLFAESSVMQMREESGRGLRLDTFKQQRGQFLALSATSSTSQDDPPPPAEQSYPPFDSLVPYLADYLHLTPDSPSRPLPPATLTAMVHFAFQCLLHSATAAAAPADLAAQHSPRLAAFLAAAPPALALFLRLTDLCLQRTADLVAGRYVSAEAALNPNAVSSTQSVLPQEEELPLVPLLAIAHLARADESIQARYAGPDHIDVLLRLLVKGPKTVRDGCAVVLGVLAAALSAEARADLFRRLATVQRAVVADPQMASLSHAPEMNALHGAVLGYAALLAASPPPPPPPPPPNAEAAALSAMHAMHVEQWYELLRYRNAQIVSAACTALGLAGRSGALTTLLPPAPAPQAEAGAGVEAEAGPLPDDLAQEAVPGLAPGALTVERIARALFHLIKTHPNNRVVEAAIAALGALSAGLAPGPALRLLADGLLSVVVQRLTAVAVTAKKDRLSAESGGYQGEETQFTFGEALACVCAGSDAEGREEFSVEVVRRLLAEFAVHPVPAIRRASAIWLLCLVQLCGAAVREVHSTNPDEEREKALLAEYALDLQDFQHHAFRRQLRRGHPCVARFLVDYQRAFQYLLTDPNEITQEAASKGLTIVYSLGDKDMQAGLVDALVNMLNGGRAALDVKITRDTELFPADFIGKAPPSSGVGNLSTYKDVCNLATEMGRPDLVYQFLSLASHHSLWNSKRAAAFGAVRIIRANFETLRPQLSAVLPKLYRNRFDPNAKIAETMQSMWDSLLPGLQESRAAVDAHLPAIAKEVVAGLTHVQYRIREASCQALSDLLGGRGWAQLGDAVVEALPMLFRVMDDVKETTARVAAGCARTVAAFVVKSCTLQYSAEEQLRDCLRRTLPVVMQQGLGSPCKPVVEYAAQLLQRICQVGGVHLRPHLPEIVATCLEYKTALEPREFQYLQNIGDQALTEEQIETARMHLSNASPLSEALKSCQTLCDAEVFVILMPRLIDLLRTGVGLPTRASTAQFIGLAAKFHAPAIVPHISALLRTCTLVLQHERSFAVKKALGTALGFVLREAPQADAEALVTALAAAYADEAGHDETDAGVRVTAGLVLQEATHLAGDRLRPVLPAFLPVAYLAMWDSNPRAAEAWTDVWRASSGGDREGVNKYFPGILALLPKFFDHQSWKKRTQAAQCLNAICKQRHAAQPELLQGLYGLALDHLTRSRAWEGKEHLLDAIANFFEHCCFASASASTTSADPSDSSEPPAEGGNPSGTYLPLLEAAVAAVVRECARPKKAYRLRAHRALVALLTAAYQHRPLHGAPDTERYRGILGATLEAVEAKGPAEDSGAAAAAEDDAEEAGDREAEGRPPRDGRLSGTNADILGQRLQILDKAFLCTYPTAEATTAAVVPPTQMARRVLAALAQHIPEGTAVATQLVGLRAGQSVLGHCHALQLLTAELLAAAETQQFVGLCVARLGQFVDREVRLTALHTVGSLYSNAVRAGKANPVQAVAAQLEALATEEDSSISDGAKRYLQRAKAQQES